MPNNGHFIRLTPETETKLNELITYYSNDVSKADKSKVVIAAIEELYKKVKD